MTKRVKFSDKVKVKNYQIAKGNRLRKWLPKKKPVHTPPRQEPSKEVKPEVITTDYRLEWRYWHVGWLPSWVNYCLTWSYWYYVEPVYVRDLPMQNRQSPTPNRQLSNETKGIAR